MAATSASIKKLVIIILLLFTTSLITGFAKSPRLAAKLIHRDSIQSPYYNLNATAVSYGRANRELRNSIARLAYLLGAKTTKRNDYRAGVIAANTHSIFLVNISIGEPPVPQLLSMDTGSSLLWLQCLPCTKCFKQFYPIFDPSKSSTYANLSCHSPYCFQEAECGPSDRCMYNVGYLDGSTSIGDLSFEKLTFQTSDEGISTVSTILIGCGHENVYSANSQQTSGILGLGPRDDRSLVFRLGHKFSYCIGDIRDPQYSFNYLVFNDSAKIEGNLSPLENFRGLYHVSLEGISVGGKPLDIDPDVFKRLTDDGGVVIDSGATLTFLARAAYEALSNQVQSLLNGVLQRLPDPSSPSRLCYRGNINRDLKWFPIVTFNFAGGAVLGLGINSMFLENAPNEFCMAVAENPFSRNLSIVGVMAQQSYSVTYDNYDEKISFQRIDCQLMGQLATLI